MGGRKKMRDERKERGWEKGGWVGKRNIEERTKVSPLAVFVFNIRWYVYYCMYADQLCLVIW